MGMWMKSFRKSTKHNSLLTSRFDCRHSTCTFSNNSSKTTILPPYLPLHVSADNFRCISRLLITTKWKFDDFPSQLFPPPLMSSKYNLFLKKLHFFFLFFFFFKYNYIKIMLKCIITAIPNPNSLIIICIYIIKN